MSKFCTFFYSLYCTCNMAMTTWGARLSVVEHIVVMQGVGGLGGAERIDK